MVNIMLSTHYLKKKFATTNMQSFVSEWNYTTAVLKNKKEKNVFSHRRSSSGLNYSFKW
jgi:hypothetical protein